MVYQKKNKHKKKYICPNCFKDYGNDKYNLQLHLNRVNPCKKKNHSNENIISDDKNIISDDKNIISDDKNIISDDKNIISDDKNIISDDKNIISDDKNIISDDKNINYNDVLNDFSSEEYNIVLCEKPNYNEILKNNNNDENIILDNEKPNYNEILKNNNNDENIILDNEKPNYNEILKNNNNDLILEFMQKMDLIIKQNEKMNNEILNLNNEILNLNNEILNLNNDINEIKEDNEKIKNQLTLSNNTPKNTTNYTLNFNFQINNFNDTKDFKGFFNNLIKEQGKNIFLKTIENLYLNPAKPENHNIYVADKNRKYAKIYNDGRWITQHINIMDEIINNIVDFYKLSIEKIKEDNEKYEKLKNQINNKIKYVEFCDLEFLEKLEDEQINDDVNNKEKIKRCLEFRKMVYDEIIILFHDNKDIVLNTHKKHKKNIIQA